MTLDWAQLGWLALLVALVTVLVVRGLYVWFVRVRGGARRQRGLSAERGAATLLARAGYTVVAHGLAGEAHVIIDGRRCPVTLHADFLVERRSKRYVYHPPSTPTAHSPPSACIPIVDTVFR